MAPGIVKRSSDSCFYGNSVKRMIRKMIRNVKHFFMWIFLIPQTTGYVFILDFVPFISVFTSFVSELDRLIL